MNQELWNKCIEFHGHACGGLALGYRACEAASEIMGFPLDKTEDEDLVCVPENDACGVDAIQCTLSCTVGKGNLILRPRGKSAYSFFDRNSGKSIRLTVKPFDRESMTKDETIAYVLNSPTEELFDIKKPEFELPEKAKLFGNKTCECCKESVREDMVRFQEGRIVCLDCFREYNRGWMRNRCLFSGTDPFRREGRTRKKVAKADHGTAFGGGTANRGKNPTNMRAMRTAGSLCSGTEAASAAMSGQDVSFQRFPRLRIFSPVC